VALEIGQDGRTQGGYFSKNTALGSTEALYPENLSATRVDPEP